MSNLQQTHKKGIARKGKALGTVAVAGVVVFVGVELVLMVAKLVTIMLPLALVVGVLFIAYKLFLEDE